MPPWQPRSSNRRPENPTHRVSGKDGAIHFVSLDARGSLYLETDVIRVLLAVSQSEHARLGIQLGRILRDWINVVVIAP